MKQQCGSNKPAVPLVVAGGGETLCSDCSGRSRLTSNSMVRFETPLEKIVFDLGFCVEPAATSRSANHDRGGESAVGKHRSTIGNMWDARPRGARGNG